MKRRLFSILLTLALCLGLMPLGAVEVHAAEEYSLWIGNARVTSENAADVFGDGKVSYDAESKTLRLNNYSYSGEGIYNMDNGDTDEYGAIFSKLPSMTIVLNGNNMITHTGETDTSSAIFSTGDITFTGSGNLTATAGESTDGWAGHSCGIQSYTGVTLDENFTGIITSIAGESCNYNGYIASVGLGGGQKLTVKNGTLVANGGTVTDTGYGRSYGIYANGYEQTGGTVISNGGTVPDSRNNLSYGMFAGNSVSISGGDFTFTGDDYAIQNVLTLGSGVEAFASTNKDGSGADAYSAGSISNYRYISNGAVAPTPPLGITFTVTSPKAGESTAIIGNSAEVSSDSSDYIIICDQYATSVDDLNRFNYFEGTFAKSDYYSYVLIVPTGDPITAISEADVAITGATFVSAEVNEYGEAKVYFKVTVTEDAAKIDAMDLSITIPENGDPYFDPDPTTTDTNYTISSASWLDEQGNVPNEFVGGESYDLDLLLKPAKGYIFADTVRVTLNGDEPVDVIVAETLSFNEIKVPVTADAEKLDPPVFDPVSGTTFDDTLDVTISIPDGATVYYTDDGSDPSETNGTVTTGAAITIEDTTTFKAVAVKEGFDNSDIVTATYTKNEAVDPDPTPTPSTGGGGTTTYPVKPASAENGNVTVAPRNAAEKSKVTITVTPDEGYVLDKLTVKDKDGKEIDVKDNGDGTYTFTMPASAIEIEATFKPDEGAAADEFPFVDVPENSYFRKPVEWAVEKGITNGVSEDKYGPEMSCTRAQVVTFLWITCGSEDAGVETGFDDVDVAAYYDKAVAWAVEKGITAGTSENEFSPDVTVTRAQFVTMLWAAKGMPEAAGEMPFLDVPTDAYYAKAVAWAYANDITAGKSADSFAPDDPCTRAQIMTFLYNAYAE